MVRVLTRIERGIKRHETEYGRPESLPQWAMLVARLLGATESNVFGFRETADRPSYDGTGYHWQDADGLRYRLAKAVKDK
jgi:hypothetical protein